MSLPKNFRVADKEFKPYGVKDLGQHNLAELLDTFPTFKEFTQRFKISSRKLMIICKKLSIRLNDLFEYSTWGEALYKKNAIYTEKWVSGSMVKTYYDIYIIPNQFVSLSLNKVAEYIVFAKFPFLSGYTKCVKRFNDDVKELLNGISLKTEVNKLDDFVLLENNITIADLYKLCKHKEYKDSYYNKSLVNIYENGHIFIELPNKGSLFLTYNDLVNNDIVSVQNRHVFSIPYYDEKGNQIPKKWFEGKQEDAPYFDCEMVKDILLRIRMAT